MLTKGCERTFDRFLRRSSGYCRVLLVSLIVLMVTAGGASARTTNQHPLCKAIAAGKLQASSGARMWCFGPQPNGPNIPLNLKIPFTSTNVDAASLSEDVAPSGLRADGQSETSIAAAGRYVVEAWNDATGFFSPCPSPDNKEENTGFGFSSSGGNSFTDLGGPPNSNCANFKLFGDPSVEAYHVAGNTYFYIASLYPNVPFPSTSYKPSPSLPARCCRVPRQR